AEGGFSKVKWGQVGVAAGAGALGGGAGVIASTATTTGGIVAANAVAGAAIGAGAAHASAAVDGKTATTGDVVKGALIGGALSGAAGRVSAQPGAAGRSAREGMSQTERVANENLVRGVAEPTRSGGGTPNFATARQNAANSAATTKSNLDSIRAPSKQEDIKIIPH